MSNGSMQFLGRQLADQAEKLGSLVVLMGEMIQGINASIPKYAIASDNVKRSAEYGVGPNGKLFNTLEMGEEIKTYYDGTVKVSVTFYTTNANAGVAIKLNGVVVGSYASGNPINQEVTKEVIIGVKEGDIIEIRTSNATGYVKYNRFALMYDLIVKPSEVIISN